MSKRKIAESVQVFLGSLPEIADDGSMPRVDAYFAIQESNAAVKAALDLYCDSVFQTHIDLSDPPRAKLVGPENPIDPGKWLIVMDTHDSFNELEGKPVPMDDFLWELHERGSTCCHDRDHPSAMCGGRFALPAL